MDIGFMGSTFDLGESAEDLSVEIEKFLTVDKFKN